MSDMQQTLKEYVKQATLNVYQNEDFVKDIVVEIPRDPSIADYATTIAMRLAKPLKTNPMVIAEKLVEELKKVAKDYESIEAVRPGFINFKMKKSALADSINVIIAAGDKYGHNDVGKAYPKTNLEYVSANPTGDLHVGHARAAAWGDSIARLMLASGYDVLREYYINDAGHQIDMLGESLIARYFEYFNRSDYPIPDNGYHAQDIVDIAKKIAEKDGDKWLNADPKERLEYFKTTGKKLELQKIKEDLENFRVVFDSWMPESYFYENNDARIKKCLDDMKAKGVLYEQDGALWLKTTLYGDDKDRVLVKNDGSFTYFLPDIANNMYKFERGCPHLIILLGADHHGYVARMQAALSCLGHPNSLDIDLEQMVRLVEDGKEVKMSKRTGTGISLRELCDDVGVDAARYNFAARELGAHMDFDLGLVRKKSSDNPVYYAQYAFARAHNVIKEAKDFVQPEKYDLLTDPKETEIMKALMEFPTIVGNAAKTRAPNMICTYVQKLASYFHSYYGSCKINDPTHKELTNERLGLVKAVAITLKNALYLVGVSAPEKM